MSGSANARQRFGGIFWSYRSGSALTNLRVDSPQSELLPEVAERPRRRVLTALPSMMFSRSLSMKCPRCQSDRLRRSRRRPDDGPWRSLFYTAYRCRQCGLRSQQQRTSWLLLGVAVTLLFLLTFVLGFALSGLRSPAPLHVKAVVAGSAPALADIDREVPSAPAPRPADPALAAAAEAGDAVSQLTLGMAYMKGSVVERNPATALKWIEKSAEQGNAEAQYALGSLHQSGRGALQDFSLALKWYEQAAQQNHAEAQNSLGVMHRDGQGVAVDKSRAYVWFNLAAAQGHERARDARDNLLSALTSEQLHAAQRATQQWRLAQVKK